MSEALKEAEIKGDNLNQGIKSLEFQKQNSFQSPPKEWIDHRLEKLHETLSKNTTSSALALKEVLGTIRLEPISDKESDFYPPAQKGAAAVEYFIKYLAKSVLWRLTTLIKIFTKIRLWRRCHWIRLCRKMGKPCGGG